MLEVKNLFVFYENALAINDLSLRVEKGQMVGVIGSNSAGKTTLMNTLSGLIIDMKLKEERRGGERITVMGEVVFNGEAITHMEPYDRAKKGIALCRERHPIFPESDVLEIYFVFDLFPALLDLKRRRAGFLSGGEQQMLAIGMALIIKPVLLLLDEPLLGLSPAIQEKLVRAIKNIQKEMGITTVISEQFARPILPMIDYGYIIENGMLTLTGPGKELMENPEVRSAYFGV
jgi:branched-chain amino acid transport system ATP-binding protein